MDSPGGGEVQMLATAAALSDVGVDASLWRPWEDRLAEADYLHLFGSLPQHLSLVAAARRQGVRVALSTIAWFDLPSYWRGGRNLPARFLASGRFILRAACPACPSWRRRLYHAADVLLPNSKAEARQLMRYFQVPAAKIHVVPNAAEERFTAADPGPFVANYGLRDFALCPGRIEPRKNQLGLINALEGTDVHLVIVGDPVAGCEDYYCDCRRAAGANVHFLSRIAHADPLLASAYAACRCLVLPGWFETPGLAAIEAAMSGTPLVLPRAGAAQEYFGDQALYVSPGNPPEIRRAVQAAFAAPRSHLLASRVRGQFTWRHAAEATRQAYLKMNPAGPT